jgi:hypothetical protein
LFKRPGFSLDKYPEAAYSLGEEFSFETESSRGKFVHKFEAGGLSFLRPKDTWYLGYMAA